MGVSLFKKREFEFRLFAELFVFVDAKGYLPTDSEYVLYLVNLRSITLDLKAKVIHGEKLRIQVDERNSVRAC